MLSEFLVFEKTDCITTFQKARDDCARLHVVLHWTQLEPAIAATTFEAKDREGREFLTTLAHFLLFMSLAQTQTNKGEKSS